jgi:hypothetical protein
MAQSIGKQRPQFQLRLAKEQEAIMAMGIDASALTTKDT